MNKSRLTRTVRLLSLIATLMLPFAAVYKQPVHADLSMPESESCEDKVTDCKPPVKYLGESRGCACFACEYGKKTQRILCSQNDAEKNKFRALLPKARI